jgi:small conductance mechanosensitive channel
MIKNEFYNRALDWLFVYGPKIIIAIIVFIIGEWLIKKIRNRLMQRMKQKKVSAGLRPFLQSFLITSMHVLLIILILQITGIRLTIFAALIAAFGAASALALSGTLQNFTSGIMILTYKPFIIGDTIIAQNKEGIVASIQLIYTIVTTADNQSVILPNSKLVNDVIINVTREGKRRLDFTFKFNFGVDYEKVKNVLLNSVSNVDLENETSKKVRVGLNLVESDGFTCIMNVWINAHGYQDTKMMINEKLLNELKSSGIIPFKN